MTDLGHQNAYWETAADGAVFTHPLAEAWVERYLPAEGRILDCGCGYGRILRALRDRGRIRLVGTDLSHAMAVRAREFVPEVPVGVAAADTLPFRDACFDAVLLFAVLTCVPLDADQRGLLAEVRRLLRPGGILYVSDFLLASDERNRTRYARDAERFGVHGVFEIEGGAVVRHHTRAWIEEALAPFETLAFEAFETSTMHGNPATAFRCVARVPDGAS